MPPPSPPSLALALRAGVLSPDGKDARLIRYPPVALSQEVRRRFRLPLSCEDALFVPHNTSDGWKEGRKERQEEKRGEERKELLVLFGKARDKVGREAEKLRPNFAFREESVEFGRG